MGTVYPRGRKLWIGFKDVFGKRRYEATDYVVGEEAKAKKVLDAIEARVTAGIAHGEREEGPLTVARYVKTWLDERRQRGFEDVKTDEGRLKHAASLGHLILSSVRPRDIRDLVRTLSAKIGPAKTDMAPRTVRHVYGTLHTMFEDALADELIEANPCVLKRGELPKKRDKDPTWRAGAVFTREEVERIISDERIPHDRRVLDALLFLAGLRFGESAALRFSDYDATMKPLGRIRLTQSYSTKKRTLKSLKTEQPREIPVHPTLAKILAQWKLHGWQATMGRPPREDDLLVPSREGRNRNSNHMLRCLHEDLGRIGLRSRRQHDARRTFISLARGDGARADILRWITHGPTGDIVDLYTTLPWETLCAEVSKLRIALLGGNVVPLRKVAGAEPYYSGYYNPAKSADSQRESSGEGGIRTRGRLLTDARLASEYLRPLGHLS